VAIIAAGAGLYFGLGMRERLRPVEIMQETFEPNALLGIDEEFPDVPVMTADSTMTTTSQLLAAGGIVIFVEPGCPPCSIMSRNWSEVLVAWDQPPTLFGISSAPLDRIQQYREKIGIAFPIVCDTGKTFETAFQVVDYPFRLIIDTAMTIRAAAYDSHELIDTATVRALVRGDTTASVTSH
jgi:peroxiredoxin